MKIVLCRLDVIPRLGGVAEPMNPEGESEQSADCHSSGNPGGSDPRSWQAGWISQEKQGGRGSLTPGDELRMPPDCVSP